MTSLTIGIIGIIVFMVLIFLGMNIGLALLLVGFVGYAAVVQHMDALSQRRISPDRFTPGYYLHCMPMRRVAA